MEIFDLRDVANRLGIGYSTASKLVNSPVQDRRLKESESVCYALTRRNSMRGLLSKTSGQNHQNRQHKRVAGGKNHVPEQSRPRDGASTTGSNR